MYMYIKWCTHTHTYDFINVTDRPNLKIAKNSICMVIVLVNKEMSVTSWMKTVSM